MKKLYSLFLAFFTAAILSAQMTVSTSGNLVTFSYTLDSNIWNSAPVYLYTFVDASNASNGVFKEFAPWPGTQMTGTGTGPYTLTVDLSSYPAGTVISNVNFIYTNGGEGGVTYQNPQGFGNSFNTTANATGWSPVTVTATLAVADIAGLSKKSVVSEGRLYTAQQGNLDIQVYDFSGKAVKTLKVKTSGNPIDLNLQQKGLYMMRISNGQASEVVKFSY